MDFRPAKPVPESGTETSSEWLEELGKVVWREGEKIVAVRIASPSERFIDYRLNILGIRVWGDSCQLIAKSAAEWSTIGPRWDLPMHVPKNAEELKAAAAEPLRLTAYQYCEETPESGLAEVLDQTRDFSTEWKASVGAGV